MTQNFPYYILIRQSQLIRIVTGTLLICLCGHILLAQNLEVIGKAIITDRDTLNEGTHVALFDSDGSMAEMDLNSAIRRYFLSLPNGIQTLLDAGEPPQTLLNEGATPSDLYGKTYAGGLIFFLDTLDVYPFVGLVSAPMDQQFGNDYFRPWGCHGTDLPNVPNAPITPVGVGADIGYGKMNTDSIMVNPCINSGDVAYQCYYLELNGYDDWFLPSVLELHAMYQNLHLSGLGNFEDTGYWSSTEYGENHAFRISFIAGTWPANFKSNEARMRAARAFGN